MSWHYRIRHRKPAEIDIYDIVEYYESPTGWTENSISAFGNTKEELIEDLECMLEDAKRYPVLEDLEDGEGIGC